MRPYALFLTAAVLLGGCGAALSNQDGLTEMSQKTTAPDGRTWKNESKVKTHGNARDVSVGIPFSAGNGNYGTPVGIGMDPYGMYGYGAVGAQMGGPGFGMGGVQLVVNTVADTGSVPLGTYPGTAPTPSAGSDLPPPNGSVPTGPLPRDGSLGPSSAAPSGATASDPETADKIHRLAEVMTIEKLALIPSCKAFLANPAAAGLNPAKTRLSTDACKHVLNERGAR